MLKTVIIKPLLKILSLFITLSHMPVIREKNETTKLCIVFGAPTKVNEKAV